MREKRPVCLIVMDGWGVSAEKGSDATALANTPVLSALSRQYPQTTLDACGLGVGLPEGQMGNSEVGHLTMGAGRVVFQELTRISKAFADRDLSRNPVLNGLFEGLRESGGSLHLMGLVSDGGVHSHITHLYGLLSLAKEQGLKRVFIHAFLDGRDTPPKSGAGFVRELDSFIKGLGLGEILTVSGRYYAMDRDTRWERVQKAYDCLTLGAGIKAKDPVSAVLDAYKRGETDEFVMPTVVTGKTAEGPLISDNDSVLFFNFRADRARELTRAFVSEDFKGFEREKRPGLRGFVCMTEYDPALRLPALFSPQTLANILGEVLSRNNIAQFRVSETEKYAHVTYFFNGGREEPFPGEERLLIPSVKHVPTYDLYPQMRAEEIAEATVNKIKEGRARFALLNLANGDMVGHTGVLSAAIKAAEAVDRAVGMVVAEALKRRWVVLITSDHGNLEQMTDGQTRGPHTAHTLNKVPFMLVDEEGKGVRLRPQGGLKDIAPTILKIMGIPIPEDMTGTPLL
jgi:2,3-bisphosphoglycerate-independent phosphoglycerate mutase